MVQWISGFFLVTALSCIPPGAWPPMADFGVGPTYRKISRPWGLPSASDRPLIPCQQKAPNVTDQDSASAGLPVSQGPGVRTSEYGTTQDGHHVTKIALENTQGVIVEFLDYGATLDAVWVPDREGNRANIVLNAPSMAQRERWATYFGSTVGRFCNRIADGEFTLDGVTYHLAKNNGHNHLHGGDFGFDRCVWKYRPVQEEGKYGVTFHLHSPDGDEGYPGNLDVTATYVLNDDNELSMEFQATCDKATPINITNHAFWNLAGADSGNVLDHHLQLNCQQYLDVDSGLIPTGETPAVQGTSLDFTQPKPIGKEIEDVNQTPANGYDHCFVVDGQPGSMRLAAVVADPASGRVMEVHTTQPGIQLYTANHLDGSDNSGGYVQNSALCLETQNYPDAPNHPDFPSSILKPGETYRHQTVHRFKIQP